jgi:ribonuclease P protein component
VNDDDPVRLGMAVGKIVGGAVERNLVRRRIRAVVAELAPLLGGHLVVVRAFSGAAALTYEATRSALVAAFAGAGIASAHSVPAYP